ncbi:MAG: hypothetical protein RLZ98_1721 [Pseudomonadota bacterium]|jgi:hypothetical protein
MRSHQLEQSPVPALAAALAMNAGSPPVRWTGCGRHVPQARDGSGPILITVRRPVPSRPLYGEENWNGAKLRDEWSAEPEVVFYPCAVCP